MKKIFTLKTYLPVLYFIGSMLVLIGIWTLVSVISKGEIPGPLLTWAKFLELKNDAFYQDENYKGIAIQLVSSLGRVFTGFALGSLVAIPLGLLLGSNKIAMNLFNPIVQILRPVSPLAWFPLGLLFLKSAPGATIFIIFITSLWPTLINTAFGVSTIPQDHKNVGKAFGFSRWKYITRIMLPFSLPHIITGLKLSIGVAWMVIVAGEMLSGGLGIGFFVWDSWNAGSIEQILVAILIIGLVGLLLDKFFTILQKSLSYENK
jgi:nitrate/nitrite transport system permease protein